MGDAYSGHDRYSRFDYDHDYSRGGRYGYSRKNDYIVFMSYSSFNGRDVEANVIHMIDSRGTWISSDAEKRILDFIMEYVKRYADGGYTIDTIAEMMKQGGAFGLKPFSYSGFYDVQDVIITSDPSTRTYSFTMHTKPAATTPPFAIKRVYSIKSVNFMNAVYIVSEHIVAPDRDCPLIERCYTEFTEDMEDANDHVNRTMENYTCAMGTSESGYYLHIADKSIINNNIWYSSNMTAAQVLNKYRSLEFEKYRYYHTAEEACSYMISDAYNEFTIEEQAEINKKIYNDLIDFISDEELRGSFEYDYENMKEGADYHDLAQDVIMYSLITAKNLRDFRAVHEKLKFMHNRINEITAGVYNAHNGKGFLMMDKNGAIGWYDGDMFALNSWKDTRFKNKCFPNDESIFEPLVHYLPRAFVDQLPSAETVRQIQEGYRQEHELSIREHRELCFEDAGDGSRIAKGTWYPDGVNNARYEAPVAFFAVYNGYKFTDNECKDLLSGDTIKIEHYIASDGKEYTIHGRLEMSSRVAQIYTIVDFARTDINKSRVLMLDEGM